MPPLNEDKTIISPGAGKTPLTQRAALIPARFRAGKTHRGIQSVLSRLSGAGRLRWLTVGIVVLLVIVGFWTRSAVNESLRTIVTEQMRVILDAEIAALETWIDTERDFVVALVERPQVDRAIRRLRTGALNADHPRDTLLAAPELEEVREHLADLKVGGEDRGFLVIDRSGLILAAIDDRIVGRHLTSAGTTAFAAILAGEHSFLRPTVAEPLIEGEMPAMIDESPLTLSIIGPLGISAPIRSEGGETIAALVRLIDHRFDFTRILSIARMGDTGETYAFDRGGNLLSTSRFEENLRTNGLLPEGGFDVEGFDYTWQLRDPGGDLTRGYRPRLPEEGRPLTQAVAAAVSGNNGLNLEGYRDYRGVTVIGGWRWIDRYDIGLVTEVDTTEAFATLRPLNIAFYGTLAMLVTASLLFLGSTHLIRHLSSTVEEAQQLGQYTLKDKIGEGGMGTVYLAEHAMLKRTTAVKLLKTEAVTEKNIARFEREVRLTSQLTHPNTIEIYDYGRSPSGEFYYAMEYLTGLNLGALLELEGALPASRVIHMLKRVCASLEEAHSIGLVHRDIKPLNIMLCQRGLEADVIKVLDFGLVREIHVAEEAQVTAPDLIGGGTPPYIAPERLKNPRTIDPRSDLFSVGAVGFNMLTGQDIFSGSSAMDICYKVMHTQQKAPSQCTSRPIPPELDDLIIECLCKKPAQRPQTARDIIDRLDQMDVPKWTQKEARVWWQSNVDRVADRTGRPVRLPIMMLEQTPVFEE